MRNSFSLEKTSSFVNPIVLKTSEKESLFVFAIIVDKFFK